MATANTNAETGTPGDDDISTGSEDDFNTGLGVDDNIDSNGGSDLNTGDNYQSDGGGGADNFQCGSGNDSINDFDMDDGDKVLSNRLYRYTVLTDNRKYLDLIDLRMV